MLRRSPQISTYLPTDSTIALVIVLLNVLPYEWIVRLRHPASVRIGLVDSVFAAAFLFAWTAIFAHYNLYSKFATVLSRFVNIVKGVLLGTIPVILFVRIFHQTWLSPHSVFYMVAFLVLYELNRIALRFYLLDRLAARNPRRAFIIGSGRRASKAWREIRIRYHSSIRLMGFIDNRSTEDMPPDVAQRYRGSLSDLADLMKTEVIDIFLIAMPVRSCYALMQEAIVIGEAAGIEVVYLNDLYLSRYASKTYAQTIFQELQPKQDNYLFHLALKRSLDVAVSLLGLIVLSPVFAAIALLIKCSGKGPVFFTQERIGFYRRSFTMYKFRTMVPHSESMLPASKHADDIPQPAFTVAVDPRTTRWGEILRATCLDELPQLWNILKGDMSLVGPRPVSMIDVTSSNTSSFMRRFSVKPGLTGLWQVTPRTSATFAQSMELDSKYIDEWSLLLDLRILWRTIAVVFSR